MKESNEKKGVGKKKQKKTRGRNQGRLLWGGGICAETKGRKWTSLAKIDQGHQASLSLGSLWYWNTRVVIDSRHIGDHAGFYILNTQEKTEIWASYLRFSHLWKVF